MISTEVESAAQEIEIHPRLDEAFRGSKGDFVGIVQRHDGKYSFFVRDLRRERPTIHGFGVDFSRAVSAVTELLDALTKES